MSRPTTLVLASKAAYAVKGPPNDTGTDPGTGTGGGTGGGTTTGTRDPWLSPGPSDWFGNIGVGSNATLTDAGMGSWSFTAVKSDGINFSVLTTGGSTLKTLTRTTTYYTGSGVQKTVSGGTDFTAQVWCVPGLYEDLHMNGICVFRDANGDYWEVQPLGYDLSNPDSAWWSPRAAFASIRGADVRGYLNAGSHGGSGMTAFGLVARTHEIEDGTSDPFPHALELNLPPAFLYRAGTDNTTGYRWPATKADTGWNSTYLGQAKTNNTYTGTVAALKMGALLSYPSGYTDARIAAGTLTHPLAIKFTRTLELRGAYVADVTGLGTNPQFAVEKASEPFLLGQNATFQSQMKTSIQALKVVTNSAKATPGGGGTPRVAALPALSDGSTAAVPRYLAGASWLWDPIPSSPVLDSSSSAYITALTTTPATTGNNTTKNAAFYTWGTPVYTIPAGGAATTYSVSVTTYDVRTISVRFPAGVAPQPGSPSSSDGAMVVIDYDQAKVYEFYDLYWTGSAWTAAGATIFPLTGDGRSDGDVSYGQVGAGFSRLAGVILRSELEAAIASNGAIPHALVFSTSIAQGPANSVNYRFPARKTDGSNMAGASDPIPEGARLQLDPSYNVETSGLTAFQKVICRTLQNHGAYCMDNGGSRVGMIAQSNDPALASPPTDPGDPSAVGGWARTLFGLTSEYADLDGLPWSQMRVLASWNGA